MAVSFEKFLTRGVEEVIVKEHLEKALRGKKLRVKFGIDPTAPDLHLGHLVPLRKLRQFQDLGHKVVLIIGDFTAMIGDPSGREGARAPLFENDVKQNMKKYLAQAAKVVDVKKAEVHYNSWWHKKNGLEGLLRIAAGVTLPQVIEREDFKKRLQEDRSLTVLEALYPLLQGYDSVAVKSDIEIGGTDQKFNLLMGRKVQRFLGMPEQDVMTLPLLEGTDGVRKMSKSYGNYIALNEKPDVMFGKVMSVPDNLLKKYYELLTDLEFPKEKPPYEAKMLLAKELVALCHGKQAAEKAAEEFIKVFSKGAAPQQMPELRVSGKISVLDLLLTAGIASKSEARRLIGQGAVEIDGKRKLDGREMIYVKKPLVLRIGKTKFFKVVSG